MILWIASYPKSGNTWIRALISTYFYSDECKFKFSLLEKIPKFVQDKFLSPLVDLNQLKKDPLKIAEFWKDAQSRVNLDNQIKFFKTHNACVAYKNKWFTDETNTAGYVYIVRDPRSIACSLASHSKISIEQAVNDLLNENHIGLNGPYQLAEFPGSWKINYLSWKKKKNFNGIIIKYEDLIDNAENEFKKILTFLNKFKKIDIDEKKISKSIISCNFSNLSQMETRDGFVEAQNNKFFRKGKKDSWKNELNSNLRKKLEENFKDEMIELGYL
tara:strand:- start:149 stop:967 length:819 start_codon:yes stop_codon:yes gene_type:complete